MRLLLLNANTSAGVTAMCVSAAQQAVRPGTEVVGATARFGAAIIQNRAQNIVGGHALLELLAEHQQCADAALIAVSYDTALAAARESVRFPVIGMTEAGLLTARLLGERIGMVTFGTPELYRELAEAYGVGHKLAAIRVLDVEPAKAYSYPASILPALRARCQALIAEDGADVVVLCGAALAGMSRQLGDVDAPVIDGITAGARLCEALVQH
jgi:allantoin racemase